MRLPATEAMLTIAPPPRLRICGMTAWVPLNGPRRLTAMTRSQSATGIAAIVCRVIVPAELTSTSIPPATAAISDASRAKAAPSATSSACPVAPPPISAATFAAASPSRSITATRAPALAKARLLAAPMPLPPPVTSTILPARSVVILSSSLMRRQWPVRFEPALEIGITQPALARAVDISRNRIGIEQDVDPVLVGRPIRRLADDRRDIGIVEQLPVVLFRLRLQLRLAHRRDFRDRLFRIHQNIGKPPRAAAAQVEQQRNPRAVRMRPAGEGRYREDYRSEAWIEIGDRVIDVVKILRPGGHRTLHLAVLRDSVLAERDSSRGTIEGGRFRSARGQYFRVFDRDLIAALAGLVKHGGHDPRRTGRAIRAFAGEKAAAAIRLGKEALRERLLGF